MATATATASKHAHAHTIASNPKPTVWSVTADDGDVATSLAVYVENMRRAKLLLDEADVAKSALKTYCEGRWLNHIADRCELPPTPIKLIGPGGVSVAFVVQDRTTQTPIAPAVLDEIGEIVGDETIFERTDERRTLTLDADVLDQVAVDGYTTVRELVEHRLELMTRTLVRAKEITRDQADALVVTTVERRFKPGLLEALPDLCHGSSKRFADVVGKLASAIVRYVKA